MSGRKVYFFLFFLFFVFLHSISNTNTNNNKELENRYKNNNNLYVFFFFDKKTKGLGYSEMALSFFSDDIVGGLMIHLKYSYTLQLMAALGICVSTRGLNPLKNPMNP